MNVNKDNIKISFVGDILPANLPYTLGFGNYDLLNQESLIDNISKPDIFFANLESPILSDSTSDEAFSGNMQILDYFIAKGINIVSIANNHILEQGEVGFYETVQLLKSKNIKVIGLNEEGTSNIESFSFNGNTICFAAFNAVHDIPNKGLYAELNESAIEQALQKMDELHATFKILTFHWGNEYFAYPNPEQIRIANFCVKQGCDLIIGHHPHVVQKAEIIDSKHVFYSLGNACFDYLFTGAVKVGLRVDITLNKNTPEIRYYPIATKGFGLKKMAEKHASLLLTEKEIIRQNEKSYINWYNQKIKKIRLAHRIKMKIYLLWLFIVLPVQNKYKLYRNVSRHFREIVG